MYEAHSAVDQYNSPEPIPAQNSMPTQLTVPYSGLAPSPSTRLPCRLNASQARKTVAKMVAQWYRRPSVLAIHA